jgi:hypothetical protein
MSRNSLPRRCAIVTTSSRSHLRKLQEVQSLGSTTRHFIRTWKNSIKAPKLVSHFRVPGSFAKLRSASGGCRCSSAAVRIPGIPRHDSAHYQTQRQNAYPSVRLQYTYQQRPISRPWPVVTIPLRPPFLRKVVFIRCVQYLQCRLETL